MGSDPHSCAPLCIVSALIPLILCFHLRAVLSQCPFQHPNTKKQADLVVLGPFPNFPFFFRSVSFPCFRGFRISAFSFFVGGRVSEETVPQPSVRSPTLRLLPNPKPLTQNSQTQWKMQQVPLLAPPQAFHQCRHKCVVCQP